MPPLWGEGAHGRGVQQAQGGSQQRLLWRQGHTSKVCLTSYEEKGSSAPRKTDNTLGPSVRVTKEAASKEPWMTEDEDKGDADHVHLAPAAV